MTIQAHDQLEEREQQLDAFHHQLKQLRIEADEALGQINMVRQTINSDLKIETTLHKSDIDYGYEQGVLNTLRQLQGLFEQTFQKEEY